MSNRGQKIIYFFSIFALLCIVLFNRSEIKNKSINNISHYFVDDRTISEILNTRTESNSSLLESLYFNGNKLLFDENNYTFYYSLIENDKDAFDPIVEYLNPSIELAFYGDAISDNSIANNSGIEVVAYDSQHYSVYKISCTTLPLMNIHTKIISEDKTKNTLTKVELFDNRENIENRTTITKCLIHVRGKTSALFPKKGFKLSLKRGQIHSLKNNNISLLGLRTDDDYILNAMYNDSEKLRNAFCSELWNITSSTNNMFGTELGNRYTYVELFLDNEYWGLYSLGYPIDDKQADITDEDYMFRKDFSSSEPTINYNDNLPIDSYRLVSNTDNDERAWATLKEFYYTYYVENDEDSIFSHLDLNNNVDFFLFNLLIQNVDGINNNFSFVIKNSNSNYIVEYFPWDMDETFGNEYESYDVEIERDVLFRFGVYDYRNHYRDLIINRYNELRNNEWSNSSLISAIDRYENQIFNSGAYLRDIDRWPNFVNEDINNSLSLFKQFVLNRCEYLDNNIAVILE